MTLSEEQRQAVREWLAAGASLADVQRDLKRAFGLALTYMDVRLLVLETGAEVKDKPEPKPAAPPPPTYAEDNEMPPYEDGGEAAEGQAPAAEATVRLTLDTIMVPGAMVSGTAVFSDGMKARWLFDQYGRFGLEPETQGYRPSQADMQAFQALLQAELRRKGYA